MVTQIIIGAVGIISSLGAYLSARRMSQGPAQYYGQTFAQGLWRRAAKRHATAKASPDVTKAELLELLDSNPDFVRELILLAVMKSRREEDEVKLDQRSLALELGHSAALRYALSRNAIWTKVDAAAYKEWFRIHAARTFNETVETERLLEAYEAYATSLSMIRRYYGSAEPPSARNDQLESRVDDMDARLRALEETLSSGKKKGTAKLVERYVQ